MTMVAIAYVVTPAAALRLFAAVFAVAFYYLWLAILWVTSASSLIMVIGRRALAEGSPVLLAASTFNDIARTLVLHLSPVALMLIFLYGMAGPCSMGSESNDTDDAKEVKEPAQERPRQILGAIIAQGLHISVPFTCLMLAADALMGTSPEKGSQMERIGSILKELGVLGGNVITCFIIVPAMVSQAWMVLQRGWVVQYSKKLSAPFFKQSALDDLMSADDNAAKVTPEFIYRATRSNNKTQGCYC